MRHFKQLFDAQCAKGRHLCVGLDSDLKRIPQHIHKQIGLPSWDTFEKLLREPERKQEMQELASLAIFFFNKQIIDATKDIAGSSKPNFAFYAKYGAPGLNALARTVAYHQLVAPEVPVTVDFKAGDIGNTNFGYVAEAFDWFSADAVTINPYFGQEAMQPFLDQKEKGIFVLCRTSNPGAGEFQDLMVEADENGPRERLYQRVARNVFFKWNTNGNCGLVVGATYPEELDKVCDITDSALPLLIPGIGTQGGDVFKTVQAARSPSGKLRAAINSSSGITFASPGEDYAEAAQAAALKAHTQITAALTT